MDRPHAPEGSAFEHVFVTLEEAGAQYAGATRKGGLYHCPVHEDETPSLEVDFGSRRGLPLISCPVCEASSGHDEFMQELRFAGVRTTGARVSDPAQIEWGAAAPSRPGGGGSGSGSLLDTHRQTDVYTYCWADGSTNFRVKRYEPRRDVEGWEARRKVFVPSHLVMGQGHVKGLDGVERTPYHLERFEEWAGKPLYLVEGEKAADALVAAGKAATTLHGGAKNSPEDDWPLTYGLGQFREVRCWPDADETGVQWMRARAEELTEAGVNVTWWGGTDLEPKDDAADVLGRGQVPSHVPVGEVEGYLDRLAALSPWAKPKSERPRTRSDGLEVGGWTLVPAEAAEAQEPDDNLAPATVPGAVPNDPNRPYLNSPTKAPYKFAEELLDRHFRDEDGTLTLRFHDRGQFWLWEASEGRYVLLTDDEVDEKVSRLVRDAVVVEDDGPAPVKLKVRTVREIVLALRSDALNSKRAAAGALLPCRGGVPFRNGWLNVDTGKLESIGPERDVRWNVPLAYDPAKAECPQWFAFLDSLGFAEGSQERRLLRQWFGYLLSGRTEQQKALLLLGPKRAGKGTILKVAKGMLGDGAVGTQLDKFGERFGMENFIGAGLVTIGDARFGMKTEAKVVERLLSLVSDDEMSVDTKYGRVQNLRLGLRLMIATNEMPNFIEASDAIATRFLVLRMEKTFYGREDLSLESKVMAELPGIVQWALDGLRDLDGLGSFAETEAGREVQEQMILDSAPVRIFVEEECELGPGYRVANDDLYAEYKLWAENNGMYLLPSNKFGRDLITAFPGQISHRNFKSKGKSVRAKEGIRLKGSH